MNGIRAFLLRLLILALVMRAGVPVGYMPDTAALQDGVLRLVICTANGPQDLTVDADGHTAPQDDDSQSRPSKSPHSDPPARHTGCVFAVAAQPLIDTAGVAVAALIPPDPAPVLSAFAAPRPDWHSISQQPRAPPFPSFA